MARRRKSETSGWWLLVGLLAAVVFGPALLNVGESVGYNVYRGRDPFSDPNAP